MACRKFRPLLAEYLEHRLDRVTQDQVRHHLERCSGCQQQCEAMERTLALFQDLPEPVPPVSEEAFVASVRERIRATTRSRVLGLTLGTGFWSWPGKRVLIPLLAAAGVMIAVLGVNYRRLLERPGTSEGQPIGQEQFWLGDDQAQSLALVVLPDTTQEEGLVGQEANSLVVMEETLLEESDIEELFGELTQTEQLELVQGLERIYRMRSS